MPIGGEMTKNKKVLTPDEIIKQLGFRPDVKFRPFTKSELDARMKSTDPRTDAERDMDRLAKDEVATIRSIRPGG